jgi:DNA-binding MarR family transcriptional regulator
LILLPASLVPREIRCLVLLLPFPHPLVFYKGDPQFKARPVVIERNVKSGDDKRKLLQLTEKGRDYAEDSLDLDTKHQGRGGIIHRYWQHRIKEAFEEQGWAAELEVFDADVYANTGETEIVVEVAMGDNQREIGHVKQHLETGFDEVWVACRNREILEGLKQRIKEQGLDQEDVTFRLLREFTTINDA